VSAGAGDDGEDYVTCGSGRDKVVADLRDSVAADCEIVRRTIR
jgi:ribose 1,5-bisphosphokinase PhnN